MKHGLFIGIDGGGTHSTAVAAWPDGRIAAIAHGGGLNFFNDGVETVRLRLESIVAELCAKADAPAQRICVGMSALDAPADTETLERFTERGIEFFRTDECGDITLSVKDGQLLMTPYKERNVP